MGTTMSVYDLYIPYIELTITISVVVLQQRYMLMFIVWNTVIICSLLQVTLINKWIQMKSNLLYTKIEVANSFY